LPRYRLTVEYDGRSFAGWQRQDNAPSVQDTIEKAIQAFSGQKVTLFCAGRTDSGVHALAQVAHFDLDREWLGEKIQRATNAHLHKFPIVIRAAEEVEPDFDARFWALERRYLYRLLNRPCPTALDRGRSWHIYKPLDIEAMRAGAAHLIGFHDFTTFRASSCQAKDPAKTLDEITIDRERDEIHFRFRSRSFLHRQVRSMVGSLKQVGEGKFPPEWIADILAARNRRVCGVVAPSEGLYLSGVRYCNGFDSGQDLLSQVPFYSE
ncbi:hypothetical protein CAPTEDRAFT_109251, partial [Capitella teleta]